MGELQHTFNEAANVLREMENTREISEIVELVCEELITCFRNGNKVMFCRNGASAAEAQHLATELSARFYLYRQLIPAEVLDVNSSYITAVANNYAFEKIYSCSVAGVEKKGDVFIGLSTSGNSGNIVEALHSVRKKEITTVAVTGKSGGLLRNVSDYLDCISSENVPRIQEMQLILGHIICTKVERSLFENSSELNKS